MGYYINAEGIGSHQKAEALIRLHGAKLVSRDADPKIDFSKIPEDKALVCVVENGYFDAAAYCYDEDEYKAFSDATRDQRKRTWLYLNKEWTTRITGYRG